MPQWLVAAAGVGAAAGAIGASTVTIFGSAILGGAVVYGGLALVSYLLRPKPKAIGTASPDTRSIIRSGLTNARWIVGRARVGGVLVWVNEPSNSDKDIHLIVVLSEGPVEGIEKMWVDGEEVAWTSRNTSSRNGDTMPEGLVVVPQAAGQNIEGDPHENKLVVRAYYNGFPDDAPATQIEGSDWTNRHRLNGKAAVHITLTQPDYGSPDSRFWKRVPNIEFLVKGLRITWPGQNIPKWTNNAAAIRYWWLTQRRQVPPSAIDRDSFTSAFAYCGALIDNKLPPEYDKIDYPPKSPRYMINGVVQSGDDHENVEGEMDFCWAGNVVEIGGIHYFRPGRDDNIGRPIPRIDNSIIISRQSIQPAPSLTDRLNAATMRLAQSTSQQWQEDDVPEIVDDEGVERDGQRLGKDLGTRSFVCCPSSAGRLLAITLRRARANKRYNIVVSPGPDLGLFSIIPTDLVVYNDPELGIKNERCVVLATVQNEDFSMGLTLERQLDGTHNDTLILPPLFERLRIQERRKPLPPTGIEITSSAFITETNTSQFLVKIAWDSTPHEIVVDIKGPESLDNLFSQFVVASGVQTDIIVPFPGTYTVSVQHRDRNGVLSDAVERRILVDASDLPDVIDINKIVVNDDGSITITWDTGNTVTFNRGKGIVNFVRDQRTGEVVITYGDGSVQRFPILDGAAGGTTEWIYRTSSGSRPATPTTTEAQRMTLDFVPAGWNDNPVSGSYVWVSSRSRTISTAPFSEFSIPSRFNGARGRTGPRGEPGLDGDPAPRFWALLVQASTPTQFPEGAFIKLPANVNTYRWLHCFGRAGDRFSWTASIDTAQLVRTGHFALQSISGRDAFIRPGVNYTASRPNFIRFNKWRSEWPDILYIDEIWAVQFESDTED